MTDCFCGTKSPIVWIAKSPFAWISNHNRFDYDGYLLEGVGCFRTRS